MLYIRSDIDLWTAEFRTSGSLVIPHFWWPEIKKSPKAIHPKQLDLLQKLWSWGCTQKGWKTCSQLLSFFAVIVFLSFIGFMNHMQPRSLNSSTVLVTHDIAQTSWHVEPEMRWDSRPNLFPKSHSSDYRWKKKNKAHTQDICYSCQTRWRKDEGAGFTGKHKF